MTPDPVIISAQIRALLLSLSAEPSAPEPFSCVSGLSPRQLAMSFAGICIDKPGALGPECGCNWQCEDGITHHYPSNAGQRASLIWNKLVELRTECETLDPGMMTRRASGLLEVFEIAFQDAKERQAEYQAENKDP